MALAWQHSDGHRHPSSVRQTMQDNVRMFHRMFGGIVREAPHDPSWQDVVHRDDLIMEEWEELHHELGRARPDLVKIAHEAADLAYTLYGLAVELGFDLDDVMQEIHRANMTKTHSGPNTKPLKGEGFRPANVEAVLHG